jgi:alpha-amylase
MNISLIVYIGTLLFIISHSDDCSNFNSEFQCSDKQTQYPNDWIDRAFQTPPRNDQLWNPNYQDMNLLVGYTQIKYNADRSICDLTVYIRVNKDKLPGDYKIVYLFNGKRQDYNKYIVKRSDNPKPTTVSIYIESKASNIATLDLEPVDYIWNHPEIKNDRGKYENGQKGAIVELFGWPYVDIEKECEFIGKAGYLGVKIFPPNEAILTFKSVENGELNPWYFIYQPVSYRLNSRHGTRDQLISMINTCRKNNVRIYADAVINHMTGNGNDMNPDHRNSSGGYCNRWGSKDAVNHSSWYTHGYQFNDNPFTNKRRSLEFPSVPYDTTDFHCERSISSWNDPFQLNYGWLVGLADLNTEKDYVRQRVADYLTDLLSIGISGIRVDAAKHISPTNLAAIFKLLANNLGGSLPDDFIAYLEVIMGGEKDLLMCNNSSSYNYGVPFEQLMKNAGLNDKDIYKIKIWESDYPKEFPICGYWPIQSERYAAGLDCHDDQFPGSSSRDMGDKGSVLVKEKNVDKHRNFEVKSHITHRSSYSYVQMATGKLNYCYLAIHSEIA